MRPTIVTWTGREVSLVNLRPADVDILDIAAALSNLCRFGGHVRRFYSVAQHSVLVSECVPPSHALEGLLHDAAEAYIGDVVKPLKNLLPGYSEIEAGIDRAIREAFGLPPEPSPCIKPADLRALATERRDLMPANGYAWTIHAGFAPLPVEVRPLEPFRASLRFLARFHEITGRTEPALSELA